MHLNKSLASLAALLALALVTSAHPVIPRSFEHAMALAMHEDELAVSSRPSVSRMLPTASFV